MKLSAAEFFRDEHQTVAVEPRDPQVAFPPHQHDFNEIFVVLSGNGWHILNDTPHFITVGEVFYVQANDLHEFSDVSDLHLINILYRLETCALKAQALDRLVEASASPGTNHHHWQITEDTLKQVKPLTEALAQETKRNDPLSRIMAESLFAQLCILLYRNRFSADAADAPSSARLGHVLTYLRHNCAHDIDLDEVAQRFGYSARNFNRLFREATGTTPHNYLVKLRIGEAMRALRQTDASITTIALAAGFNDSNYFSYAFNKLTGMSPSEYRRLSRIDLARAESLL